jgi:hypothetical protein
MRTILIAGCAWLCLSLLGCADAPPTWLGPDGGGDAGPDADTDVDTDIDTDVDTDTDTDIDTDTDVDTDTDTGTDTVTDTGSDTGTGSEVNPLVGMVFVQAGGVGVASYHFDAVDDIYINYSAAPYGWVLDSGDPFPDQKPFIETSFDLDLRTFYGTIDWSSPEATTVNGADRWVYEMIFSDDYQTISGGSIRMYSPGDTLLDEAFFGVDLFYTAL